MKKMQSKKYSMLESIANVVTGSLIAFGITQLGSFAGLWSISPAKNLLLTVTLTFVSFLRSYFWRRLFNKKHTTYKVSAEVLNLKFLGQCQKTIDRLIKEIEHEQRR